MLSNYEVSSQKTVCKSEVLTKEGYLQEFKGISGSNLLKQRDRKHRSIARSLPPPLCYSIPSLPFFLSPSPTSALVPQLSAHDIDSGRPTRVCRVLNAIINVELDFDLANFLLLDDLVDSPETVRMKE